MLILINYQGYIHACPNQTPPNQYLHKIWIGHEAIQDQFEPYDPHIWVPQTKLTATTSRGAISTRMVIHQNTNPTPTTKKQYLRAR